MRLHIRPLLYEVLERKQKDSHPLLFFWRCEMLEKTFVKQFRYDLMDRTRGTDLDYIYPKTYVRSQPDLVILGPNMTWAALEFKRDKDADRQPMQEWHINRLKKKGYAGFVYPENREEVLDELEELFTS